MTLVDATRSSQRKFHQNWAKFSVSKTRDRRGCKKPRYVQNVAAKPMFFSSFSQAGASRVREAKIDTEYDQAKVPLHNESNPTSPLQS